MSNLTEKTTIYLTPRTKKFILHKAVTEGRSASDIINDTLEDMLEDLDDIKEIQKRRKEPSVSFENALKELKKLPKQISLRLTEAIYKLSEDPRKKAMFDQWSGVRAGGSELENIE
jgi:Arc/MetJ-type ribon-helix-helix transcriptional regulator